jgi:hypothetical protein
MFTNTIKETKRKINLTINPTVYRTFSEIAEKRLQPKSWIIESMMKNYITSNMAPYISGGSDTTTSRYPSADSLLD